MFSFLGHSHFIGQEFCAMNVGGVKEYYWGKRALKGMDTAQ